MSEPIVDHAREAVDAIYRSDSRRVLATLIRLLGGFELAEEALHEAFAAAVDHRGFRRRRALGHHTCSPLRMGAEQAGRARV